MSMFPLHRYEPPRSLESIIEFVEHGMAFDAHRLCLVLEPHKRDSNPEVHSIAHRLATVLRDFALGIENATTSLSPQTRASLKGR